MEEAARHKDSIILNIEPMEQLMLEHERDLRAASQKQKDKVKGKEEA